MLKKKNAIIIGAGAAGLTAAYYLLTMTDIRPIVLEREKFIGGLAATLNFGGNRLDIGGHKFFSENPEILSFWQKFSPAQETPEIGDRIAERKLTLTDDGANNEKVDDFLLSQNFVSGIFYQGKIFSCPVTFNFETARNIGFFKTFSIGASIFKSKLNKREEKTLEDFMINHFGKRLYENFLRDYTTKILGRSPQQTDIFSFGKVLPDFVKEISGFKDGANKTARNDKFFYPKLGAGQLWEKVADEIKKLGGEVLFSTTAESFRVDKNKVVKSVTVKSAAGKLTFPADYFLSSIPLVDLAGALEDEILSARPRRIAEGLPYRDLIIVGLLVDKQKFNIPYKQIYIQEPTVKLGCLQIFNNWSPYMVVDPKNFVWLGLEYFCNDDDELWQMREQDFIKFAIDELAEIGIIDSADVCDSVHVKVPKAYPSYFETYENISELRVALDEIKNLYCIGRNGQHCCDSMDHVMLTAFAAVRSIAGNFSKSDIWRVNAEKDNWEGKSNE